MQDKDINSVYLALTEKRAIPGSFAAMVAEHTGINGTTVRACLNGNKRMYVSEEAKNKITAAAIQILSEKKNDIQQAITELQQSTAEPAV